MTQKPVKHTKSAARSVRSRPSRARGPTPSHVEIAERAYFIHLQEAERDQVANWLRAERELAVA